MKKVINKGEREEILFGLVSAACLATGVKIGKELRQLRNELHKQLLGNWEHNMPSVSRANQLKLIQEQCAYSLTFGPTVYKPNGKGSSSTEGEFGRLAWSNDGGTDKKKQLYSMMASRIFRLVPGLRDVAVDGVSVNFSSAFSLPKGFSDIIRGFTPANLYRDGAKAVIENKPFNDALLSIHDRSIKELTKLKDLLDSAEKMFEDLGAVIAPLKTAQALAEAMPEAVKHFPPSLMYVKPTKELADPKAINEIRAKLKAGLPI